jgi:ABC-type multidrug transport system ATPase subunit
MIYTLIIQTRRQQQSVREVSSSRARIAHVVDLETDAQIQETIHREFAGKTILCIAHRLRTIMSWNRILVMDEGNVVEFDGPLELFDRGGLFRGMCDQSGIAREEIVRASRQNSG